MRWEMGYVRGRCNDKQTNNAESTAKHTESTVNHTEYTLNHIQSTLSHTQSTISHTQSTVNHNEHTTNNTESTTNHTQSTTTNHNESTLNHTESTAVLIKSTVSNNQTDPTGSTVQQNVCIITGPNMGGKSTYMRQLGLIVLMAQIGCFVPAKKAQLPAFSALYTRVGASDNQSRGVSTFMSEMIDMSNIMSACGEEGGPSLILIDELGRGTSTYDGLGLSWGILEFILREIPNCFCLFTTHFYELTTIAKQFPAVKNIHVTALNKETYITMLYGVREGPSDQSFGINVAQLCNFPKEVIRVRQPKRGKA